jgi:hypothetical protein
VFASFGCDVGLTKQTARHCMIYICHSVKSLTYFYSILRTGSAAFGADNYRLNIYELNDSVYFAFLSIMASCMITHASYCTRLDYSGSYTSI